MSGNPQPLPPAEVLPKQGHYLMASSTVPPLPQYPPQTAASSQAQYPPSTTAASYSQGSPHQQLQPQVQYVQQQPMAQLGMTIRGGGGNRNVKNLPVGQYGREWSHGLCSCCTDQLSTCLFAWCCPCIVYGQNKHRLNYLATHGTPDPTQGGNMVSSDCMLMCCALTLSSVICCWGCAGWIFPMVLRTRIRQRYGIRGGGCADCWTALCCPPCELTQESREIELEELSFSSGLNTK